MTDIIVSCVVWILRLLVASLGENRSLLKRLLKTVHLHWKRGQSGVQRSFQNLKQPFSFPSLRVTASSAPPLSLRLQQLLVAPGDGASASS